MDTTWIEQNSDTLRLPIHITNDSDYLTELEKRYEAILDAFKGEELSELKCFSDTILKSVHAYYNNDTIESYEVVYGLMTKLMKDSFAKKCFSSLQESNVHKNKAGVVPLFRAREGTSYVEYSAEEMGFVPFEQRSKCASNRYSIAGIPCLYLGNTSYVCWLEMNCPSDDKFCVAPYRIDGDLQFFNVAIPLADLYEALENGMDRQEFLFLIKIYLLEIATSFQVKQEGRSFHSEYIISQNIMKACIRLKLNGIIYYTTRTADHFLSIVCGINIALFIDYSANNNISTIFETKTKHGDAINYAMFKNLLPSQNYMRIDLAVDNTGYFSNIGSMKNQIKYQETRFYEFDNYIFARWCESIRRSQKTTN